VIADGFSDVRPEVPAASLKLSQGGQHFETRFGYVATANITPDAETGIGKCGDELFRRKFYDYKLYAENGCYGQGRITRYCSVAASERATHRPSVLAKYSMIVPTSASDTCAP
jgi:hypothetical protein